MLRATEEWNYVEREVDIRVERERLDAGIELVMAADRPSLRRMRGKPADDRGYAQRMSKPYCSRNFPEAICGRPVTGQL